MQPSRQVPAVLLSFLFRPSSSTGDGKVFRHPLLFQLPQPFLLALVKALLQHAGHVAAAARETRGGASGGASGGGVGGGGVSGGGGGGGGQGVQDVLAKGSLEVLRHLMPVEEPSGNNSISFCVRRTSGGQQEDHSGTTVGQQWDNSRNTGGQQEDHRRTTGGPQ